jgi:hypothetical protein
MGQRMAADLPSIAKHGRHTTAQENYRRNSELRLFREDNVDGVAVEGLATRIGDNRID